MTPDTDSLAKHQIIAIPHHTGWLVGWVFKHEQDGKAMLKAIAELMDELEKRQADEAKTQNGL